MQRSSNIFVSEKDISFSFVEKKLELLLFTLYKLIFVWNVTISMKMLKHANEAWFKTSYVRLDASVQQIIKDTSSRSVTCTWANESHEKIDAKDKIATVGRCLCYVVNND